MIISFHPPYWCAGDGVETSDRSSAKVYPCHLDCNLYKLYIFRLSMDHSTLEVSGLSTTIVKYFSLSQVLLRKKDGNPNVKSVLDKEKFTLKDDARVYLIRPFCQS